jgi:hypothetical protein
MRNIIAVFIVLVVNSICFAEAPVADKPIYNPGDTWVYVKDDGKKVKLEFLRTEDDKYIFLKNGKKEVVMDADLCDTGRKAKGRFPGPIIKFPLMKGKTWDYTHKFGKQAGPDVTKGGPVERTSVYEVTEYEQVTVPAGTFRAFKIVVTVEMGVIGKGQYRGTHEYWYAPEVKQIVKSSEYKIGTMKLKKYKLR